MAVTVPPQPEGIGCCGVVPTNLKIFAPAEGLR
jgi:hypothetical protein